MMPVSSPATGNSSVEQAIRALETVLSPLASSSERAAANQYCEALKEDVAQSLHLALAFVPFASGYALPVRQFGLNLLESLVKRLGQSAALTEQGFLEQLWALAFGPNGLNDQGESRAVKEKMAVVLVQAAVRVWPQRWPGLFDQLLAECRCLESPAGPASPRQALNAELAVTVVRLLAEEIHQAADNDAALAWDEQRKSELQAAFALVLPGYAEWLWAVIPVAANRSRPDDASSMALLSAAVKAWGAVVPLAALPEKPTPLAVGTLFNLAQVYDGGVREEALDALIAFSSRIARTGDDVLLARLLDQEAERIEQLLTLFVKEGAAQSDEAEEAYGHLKRVAEILVNLATATIAHKRHPAIPKKLAYLLRLLLDLLGLPSLIVRSLASMFWGSAIRGHDRLWAHADLQASLPSLFMRVLGGLATDRKAERRHRWNRADFEAGKDFDEVAAATVNRLVCLLEALAAKHAGTIDLLGGALAGFCQDPSNAAALRSPNAPLGVFAAQWAALSTATDAVTRGLGKRADASVHETARPLLDGLLAGVIDPNDTAPETILGWLACVRGLAVLLAASRSEVPPSLLPGMMGLAMGFRATVPSDEVHVRGRVCQLLLKLASVSADMFRPHLEYLAGLLDPVDGGQPGLSVQQSRFLTELLLTVAGSEGVEYVDRAVRPVLLELERAAPWFGSAGQLKQAIVDSNGEPSLSSEFRRSVSNLLAQVYILCTRLTAGNLSQPVAEYVRGTVAPRLSSALLSLLCALQALERADSWSPGERTLWHDLFARKQPDATNVLAAFDPLNTDAAMANGTATTSSTLRGWLSTVKVSALVSLGLLAKTPKFFEDRRQLDAWAKYLAGCDSAQASPWSLTWVVKHALHPLLISALASADDSSLALRDAHAFSTAFDQFFSVLAQRLDSDWASLSNAGSVEAASSLEEELERESEFTMLATAVVNLLYDVLYPACDRGARLEPFLDLATRQPPGPPTTVPCALWLATGAPERVVTVLRLVVSALTWRPSVGTSKVFLVASRWLSVWATTVPHRDILFAVLFDPSQASMIHACLVTLAKPALADLHPTAAGLAGELYKWAILLQLDQPALQRCLASLPAITPRALSDWRLALSEPGQRNSVKLHREASRAFFRPLLSATATEASGKSAFVPRLPEKLMLIKRLKEVKEDEVVTAEDIDALFA